MSGVLETVRWVETVPQANASSVITESRHPDRLHGITTRGMSMESRERSRLFCFMTGFADSMHAICTQIKKDLSASR